MKTWVFVVMTAGLLASPAMAQVDSLTTPPDTASAAVDTTAIVPPPPAEAPIETSTSSAERAIEVVRLLEGRRQSALVAADTKELAEIFAPDATYVHANGIMQTPAELYSVLERGDIRYVSFAVEDVRYRAYGAGATVVVTGAQRLSVKSAGKSAMMRSRYTAVYAVEGDGARLVAYQSTPTPNMTARP